MSEKMHHCVRVYPNGDRRLEPRSAEDLPGWIEHNSVFRFGNALFVDGACIQTGYLAPERCNAIAVELKAELASAAAREI